MNPWNFLLIQPLTSLLQLFYELLFNNLGLAVIALTLFLRLITVPLTLPALKVAEAQKRMKPELDSLKRKYGKNKQKFAEEQMKLFKKHGVNPFAGCLPQILQILILIAMYQVLLAVLRNGQLDPDFLVWDLSKKDPYLILPAFAAATQFVLSKLMLPQAKLEHEVAHKKSQNQDGKAADFATVLQQQNLYFFPVLTFIIGLQFPSGLMLYWAVSTLFQLLQQLWVAKRN